MGILEKKALSAIDNYKVDLVVANELHTNKYKVIIYDGQTKQGAPLEISPDSAVEIEEPLIKHIIAKHQEHLQSQS